MILNRYLEINMVNNLINNILNKILLIRKYLNNTETI